MIPSLIPPSGEDKGRELLFEGGELEIAVLVLKQMLVGEGEDAKKKVCDAAADWIQVNTALNKIKDRGPAWQVLVENVFPNRPNLQEYRPGLLRYVKHEGWVLTYKDFFYELCNRHEKFRDMKKLKEAKQLELIEATNKQTEALRSYFASLPATPFHAMMERVVNDELTHYGQKFAFKEMLQAYKFAADEYEDPERRSLMTAFRKAWYLRNKLASYVESMDEGIEDAEKLLTQWTVISPMMRSLMPRRQPRFDTLDYPANPDNDVDGNEQFTDWNDDTIWGYYS